MKISDRVRIATERGFYWVVSEPKPDGSVIVFGGSKDPNGVRRHRSVKVESLRPDTRSLERSLYPSTLRGE